MIGEAPAARYNISLPPEIAERIRKAGGGNLSAGVRKGDEALNAAKKVPAKKTAQER